MRHRIKKKKLGRLSSHRQALIRNLLRSLFLDGQITTTQTKAKEVKRWADKSINKAQENTVHSKRELHKIFGKTDVVNALVDKIAPVLNDRKSGFTTISQVGRRRGDNVMMYRLELVKKPAKLGSFQVESKQEKK